MILLQSNKFNKKNYIKDQILNWIKWCRPVSINPIGLFYKLILILMR